MNMLTFRDSLAYICMRHKNPRMAERWIQYYKSKFNEEPEIVHAAYMRKLQMHDFTYFEHDPARFHYDLCVIAVQRNINNFKFITVTRFKHGIITMIEKCNNPEAQIVFKRPKKIKEDENDKSTNVLMYHVTFQDYFVEAMCKLLDQTK